MPNPETNYYMCTLTPRTAKSGNKYFTGVMGSLSLVAFYAKDGERLNIYVAGNIERKDGPREGGWKPKPKAEPEAAPPATPTTQDDIPF